MAWFFSANTAALDGLNSLPDNVQIIVEDAQLFINNTESELVYLTNNNFNEFSENVDTTIDDIDQNIRNTIDTVITDIHFNELVNISNFLIELATNFNTIKLDEWETVLIELRSQLSGIKNKIEKFKTDVYDSPFCQATPTDSICVAVEQIPDLDTTLLPQPTELDQFKLSTDILNAIDEVRNATNDADTLIKSFTSEFIQDNVEEIKNKINEIKTDINKEVDDIIQDINKFSVETLYEDELQKPLLDAQDYFDYVYYTVLGFGLFLVAILALYAIGICLGAFGKVGGPAKRQGM